ncbi:phage minor capsid protein [Streptomyces phaeoluteigriseus]
MGILESSKSPGHDAELLERLRRLLEDFTPRVQIIEPASAVLDLTGPLQYWRRDTRALTEVVQLRALAYYGLPSAAGAGPTPTLAAMACALTPPARAAGLFHPNCRHSLSAYLPGVSTRPPHHATPGMTYEDTQRQREIERHIRAWKRRQAAAMDEAARRRAGVYVRKWQAAIRKHVAEHPDLRRKPQREQPLLAR